MRLIFWMLLAAGCEKGHYLPKPVHAPDNDTNTISQSAQETPCDVDISDLVTDTGVADKYRLVWNDTPATTMTVGWNQLVDGTTLLFADANEGCWRRLAPDRNDSYLGMESRFVRLKGLKPDSRYDFRICAQNRCSPKMWFKTAPQEKKPFVFISGGDSRSIPEGRLRGNRLVAAIRPLFVLHGGDFTARGTADEWARWLDEWQQTKSSDGRVYPIVPTHGNHENADRRMLYHIFDIKNPDAYYTLKIGEGYATFWVLNTELEPGVGYGDFRSQDGRLWEMQSDWLKETLDSDRSRWQIVSYHRPIRPHRRSKPEGEGRYEKWAGIFYRYGVDLAIESDSHVVKYTLPIRPDGEGAEGFGVDYERGTVYIGEGSWGAPTRENDDDKPWTLQSGSFWQFKVITVDTEAIRIRTVKFGSEAEPYDTARVTPLTWADRERDPYALPAGLDLWRTPAGNVYRIPLQRRF